MRCIPHTWFLKDSIPAIVFWGFLILTIRWTRWRYTAGRSPARRWPTFTRAAWGATPWVNLNAHLISPALVSLSFAGSANSSWNVERAMSLQGPWTNLGAVMLSQDGVGHFNDTNPPAASSFYRAKRP